MQENKWHLAEQVVGVKAPGLTDLTVEELLELLEESGKENAYETLV